MLFTAHALLTLCLATGVTAYPPHTRARTRQGMHRGDAPRTLSPRSIHGDRAGTILEIPGSRESSPPPHRSIPVEGSSESAQSSSEGLRRHPLSPRTSPVLGPRRGTYFRRVEQTIQEETVPEVQQAQNKNGSSRTKKILLCMFGLAAVAFFTSDWWYPTIFGPTQTPEKTRESFDTEKPGQERKFESSFDRHNPNYDSCATCAGGVDLDDLVANEFKAWKREQSEREFQRAREEEEAEKLRAERRREERERSKLSDNRDSGEIKNPLCFTSELKSLSTKKQSRSIKKSFLKASKLYHPDNGCTKLFRKETCEKYFRKSDEQRKALDRLISRNGNLRNVKVLHKTEVPFWPKPRCDKLNFDLPRVEIRSKA